MYFMAQYDMLSVEKYLNGKFLFEIDEEPIINKNFSQQSNDSFSLIERISKLSYRSY